MSKKQPASFQSYTAGFVLSIVFTVMPFWLVMDKVVSGTSILILLAIFAIVQVLIQLTFFLHLHQEPNPRWQGLAFRYMVVVVVIVVFGSIWIMNNLHYHMTPGEQVDEYIMEKEAIERHQDHH